MNPYILKNFILVSLSIAFFIIAMILDRLYEKGKVSKSQKFKKSIALFLGISAFLGLLFMLLLLTSVLRINWIGP